jgi:hypothetical protein
MKFVRLITLYLDVNSEIHDTDMRKIAFALSFMKEGSDNEELDARRTDF